MAKDIINITANKIRNLSWCKMEMNIPYGQQIHYNISGHRYHIRAKYSTKSEALARAKRVRKSGILARVKKVDNGYLVLVGLS
jgi:hypothetical protein